MLRPLVLLGARPAAQRAAEPPLPPETVRAVPRRFRQHGLLGLVPEQAAIVTPRRGKAVPATGVAALARLQALYDGFGARAWARMIWQKTHARMDDQTVPQLGPQRPGAVQGAGPLGPAHRQPQRYQSRLEVIKRAYPGWTKRSLSHFLPGSRPTVERWLGRREAEPCAGLRGHQPGPKAPPTVWFPLMVEGSHRQQAPPDAGECRLWRLLASEELAVRPGGRVLARKRPVYDEIPHHRQHEAKNPPQPQPSKAPRPHHSWCIDGRMLDCAWDGGRWWRRLLLAGSARTLRAGAGAPAEASWVALMVLSTAWRRYGVPACLISDSGGALPSNACEAVWTR